MEGLLGDLQHLRHLLAFAEHPLGLPELADDLLGGVSPCHLSPPWPSFAVR